MEHKAKKKVMISRLRSIWRVLVVLSEIKPDELKRMVRNVNVLEAQQSQNRSNTQQMAFMRDKLQELIFRLMDAGVIKVDDKHEA